MLIFSQTKYTRILLFFVVKCNQQNNFYLGAFIIKFYKTETKKYNCKPTPSKILKNTLYKKNVPIPARVAEHRPSGNKQNR